MELTPVDEYLYVSDMPSEVEVRRLYQDFDLIISLAEYPEYDPEVLGDKFLEIPTPDLRAPNLLEVHLVLDRVEEVVRRGGKVLVHCVSGLGRSGTFAALYLVRRYELRPEEALERIRSLRPGAVETREQEVEVWEYGLLLRYLGKERLTKIIEFGAEYEFGRGVEHAWKVLDLSLQLSSYLEHVLDLRSQLVATVLAPAAILHDVGAGVRGGEESHHVHSYRIVLEEGRDVLSEYTRDVAVVVKHHRARTDPRRDPEVRSELLPYIAVLRVADALDYTLDQCVTYLEYRDGTLTVHVTDPEVTGVLKQQVRKKAGLLQELLRQDLRVEFVTEET